MFNRYFQRSSPTVAPADAHAERSLMAEALLRAAAQLLGSPTPTVAVKSMCESIVEASPHMALVWAWFGGAEANVIEPQIVCGPAREYAETLSIKRNFITEIGPAYGVLRGRTTRAFDVSSTSLFGPWRDLARRFGVRSVLVVPISNAGDARGLLALYSTQEKYFDGGVGLFDVLGQLFHAVLTQSHKRAELESDLRQDAITGVHTRRHAQRLIDDMWQLPPNHQNRGVLLSVDIDEFKTINDTYGHRAGDIALRHVAQVLEKNLRGSDVIARWGGDEFLVWLPALSGTGAMAIAEQLRVSVAQTPPDVLEGMATGLRISIGATPVPDSDSFATALDRADRALLRAKQNGRNCVVVARPGA